MLKASLSNPPKGMAAYKFHFHPIVFCVLIFYSCCVHCGRDARDPIHLIPQETEDVQVTMETGKNAKDEVFMQHLFQQIEDKLFKPNFDNLIRHMDRFTRAILKLDARVDSIYNQMDDFRKQTSNCSTEPQISRLQSNIVLSLDDLDQKLDQIQRQLKLSSVSTVHTTIEDINQRTRDIQMKLHQTPASPTNELEPRLVSLEEKQSKLNQALSPLINANVTSHLESIDKTLNDISSNANATFHNKYNMVVLEMEHQAKSVSKMESLMEQNNDEHYKWFGNLISMFNDGIDRIETNCVLSNSGKSTNANIDDDVPRGVQSLSVLEHQMETILHKIEKLEKSSLVAPSKPDSRSSGTDWHECSLIMPLMTQISDTIGFKFDQIYDVCYREEGILAANINKINEKLNKMLAQGQSSDLLNTLDLKSNMTQEKLNYVTSMLTMLQMDQSSINMNVKSLLQTSKNTTGINEIKENLEFVKQHIQNNSHPHNHHRWAHVQNSLTKIQSLLTRHRIDEINVDNSTPNEDREQLQIPSDISFQLEKIGKKLDRCSIPREDNERLNEQNANNLQDLKEALMYQAPIQMEYSTVLSKVESQIATVNKKLNSITGESVEKLSELLEESRKSQNNTFLSDLEMSTKIDIIYQRLSDDSSFEILSNLQSDMRMLLIQLHPLIDLPTQLYNFTQMSSKTSVSSDIDSFFWSRTSRVVDSMAELQKRMEDTFLQLKNSLQNTVDDGMVEIVDILGQNKNWLQQTASSFVAQHSDNLVKMKESVSTMVTKGFDNLHFMYQYLNRKLDQIHLIASHNMEDCADVFKSGHTTSGIYTVYPRKSKEMRVYCDMDTEGGGWTVIQRRDDRELHPRISFNRTWVEYKYGFGNLDYEFWLGNENIHTLTYQNNYMLRIDMVYAEPQPQMPQYKRKFWHNLGNDTKSLYAQYSHFRVRSEHFNYTLLYDKYMGIHPYDGLDGRVHSIFTTWDHAKDINLGHCAKIQGGGWWYGNECFRYALNSKPKKYYWEDGSLFTGITWGGTADFALLKLVEMKIIPMNVYQSNLMRKV